MKSIEKDNQSVAVTLNKEKIICNQAMYLTAVPNVVMLLLKEEDNYIEATYMKTEDMLEEVMREADVWAALNTIELSLDKLYKNLNMRMCEMSRTDINITSALLNTLYDDQGAPLLVHVNGRWQHSLNDDRSWHKSDTIKASVVRRYPYGLGQTSVPRPMQRQQVNE